MRHMSSSTLKLRRCPDLYYRTSWYDDRGWRHTRSFGKARNRAYIRFGRFHAEWQRDRSVRNPSDETPLTIRDGWERFRIHAEGYYCRPDGTPTGEALNIEHAMRPVLELFGDIPAEQFGPKALKAVRDRMIEDDLCINVINQRIRKIRHVFKWLAGEELIPASVWHGLLTIEALKAGRTDARVTVPVAPVAEEHVWQVVEHVPPTVKAMIELQSLTGMRPAEVCSMRPIDIDMDGSVWIYRPVQHKTHHHSRQRIVPIGPRAQTVIMPFLSRDVTSYLFSPREALRQRFDKCRTHRHQPVEQPKSERRVGDRYTPQALGYYIRSVCKRHGIPHWSPNQLRHNAATRLRKEFGLDVAQIVLGHSRADVTQLYAELDLKKAVAAMEKIG